MSPSNSGSSSASRMFGVAVFAVTMVFAVSASAKSCVDEVSRVSQPRPTAIESADVILAKFPLGGIALSNAIRDLVVADADAVAGFSSVLAKASTTQRESVARGLAQASAACAAYVPETPARLRVLVAQAGDPQLVQVFDATSSTAGSRPPAANGTEKCYLTSAPLSEEAVKRVKAKPADLLDRNPDGGPGLSNEIRNLVISDASFLDYIKPLITQGNQRQKIAIAAGLGQAANNCEVTAPSITQLIQKTVVAAASPDAEQTFLAVVGNRAVGAVGFAPIGAAASPYSAGGGGALGNTVALTVGTNDALTSFANPSSRFSFSQSSSGVYDSITRSRSGGSSSGSAPVSP